MVKALTDGAAGGKIIQAFYWYKMFGYILSSVIPSDSLFSSSEAASESASSLHGMLKKFEAVPAVQRKSDIHFTRQKNYPATLNTKKKDNLPRIQ